MRTCQLGGWSQGASMSRRKRRVTAGIGKCIEEGERGGVAAGIGGFVGESMSRRKRRVMQEWGSALRREKEAEWQQE